MAKRGQGVSKEGQKVNPESRTISLASRGIKTGEDFANLMSSLMSDILQGNVSPSVANAACNAGGKLLKVVEMQYKHAPSVPTEKRSLILATGKELEP